MQNRSQKLLSLTITIYLLMVSGTFAVNLYLSLNPRGNRLQLDVSDRVEKEVDRSYNRFITQFNFALFLIGTSVWIFRQSVVDQLKIDVKKDVGESLKKELEEKIQEEVLLELSHTKEELKRTIEEQIQKESSEI